MTNNKNPEWVAYGARLRKARKLSGLKQPELFEKSGVKVGTISKIERGDQGNSVYNMQLAKALGINPFWLQNGTGNMHDKLYASVEIPVLMPHEVLAYLHDRTKPKRNVLMLKSPLHCSDSAFFYEVPDDSMTGSGHDYPQGVIVQIDPAARSQNGSKVLAQVGPESAPVFRKYVIDVDGSRWLHPLNLHYKSIPLTDDSRLLGVCLGMFRPER